MKTLFYVTFLFLLFTTRLWCQNPGYMGKKTVVGYGMHVNPLTGGSTSNNKTLFGGGYGSAERGYFRLNYTHDFFIERTLSSTWLIAASIKYTRTGFDNRAFIEGSYDRPTGYYQINALTFTPYLKQYYRRYIAPWGRYFVFGPTISRLSAKHDAFMHVRSTVNGHDTLLTDFGADKKQYSFDFLLGFGRNRIIANRISIDYGYNFHVISMLTLAEYLALGPYYGGVRREEYISETMKKRMRGINRFNVFIKIGYLF